ncbi:DUF2264 domain-containing protein [Actinoplanes couchii]|uniref:DUF2264 domain-containing protein n=1 Tax=Actinoplanes couchii TaxID=403638 RepID=A0ABQ3XHG1_9ACTN|nr:hypothetical protein Aco03nite_063430 [Actinoplanes couchii]
MASRNGVGSDGLEGFARTFLLAACTKTHLDRYAEGLVNGTTPGHPFAWDDITDMSQQIVEAASIAIALHETRDLLFDRLSDDEQQRVTDWLGGIRGRRTPDSNWILFRLIVETFLETVTRAGPAKEAQNETSVLSRLDDWYAGDGWYSDGSGQNFDYYNAYALHLYPLLQSRMTGAPNPYQSRLNDFLDDHQHFFAPNGSPVFQGRSLTYRFATVAPLWFGDDLPPGRIRRLASGVLKNFIEREPGALLTRGWHHPFPPMIQSYSGPASPYWASKAFLGLLLPETHPVWTATEEPAEIELHDVDRQLRGPGWRIVGTRTDGVIRLLNHGSDRAAKSPEPDPLYVRLAYSTHTSPQFTPDAVDNQITIDGSSRHHIQRITTDTSAYTDGPVHVITTTRIEGAAEVRTHEVTAPSGSVVRAGGYAIAGDSRPDTAVTGEKATTTRPDGLTSSIESREGFTTAKVRHDRGTDAFGEFSATPYLEAIHPGGTHRYTGVVRLFRATA